MLSFGTMDQHCPQKAFNRLPSSTMQSERYHAYQQASHQQDYERSFGFHNTHHFSNTTSTCGQPSNDQLRMLSSSFNRNQQLQKTAPSNVSMQFSPSVADPHGSFTTNLIHHQNTTLQMNSMPHIQHTSCTWAPLVPTAVRSVCNNNMQIVPSHQPLNGQYIMETTLQPEISPQQTSLTIQSNQRAQRIYTHQDPMRVRKCGSCSSDNPSPGSSRPKYRCHIDQTDCFVNQVPVQSSFDCQPSCSTESSVMNSQINNSMNCLPSPTITPKHHPQHSTQHSVFQSQLNQNAPALFLHKDTAQHHSMLFEDLIKEVSRQQSNNVPTSVSHSMTGLFNAVTSQVNTHPQAVQSNNKISAIPRISQYTAVQQSSTIPTSGYDGHDNVTGMFEAVACQDHTHQQAAQHKNVSGIPIISQDTTFNTPITQVQNLATSNIFVSSNETRPGSQFVAQQNGQGQTGQRTVASCKQVQPTALQCSVPINPIEEVPRASECQPLLIRTDVSRRQCNNLEASCNQGFERRFEMMNDDNGQEKVQLCKNSAETLDIVMTRPKVIQKAIAVVSPISQKSYCLEKNNVNTNLDESLPKINAVRTFLIESENTKKQLNALQPKEITLHSSSIPETLKTNIFENEILHNTTTSAFQNINFPQQQSSVFSSDLLKNNQNIDYSINGKLVTNLAKHKNNAERLIVKIINNLLHKPTIEQHRETINNLKDGHGTQSSAKENINISPYMQKMDHFTSKQNLETSNCSQNIKPLDMLPNVISTNQVQNFKSTHESLHDKQRIETSNDGQFVGSVNSDREQNNDSVFDLSKVQVCNFTLEKQYALVKSLEVKPADKEKETDMDIKESIMELFWDSNITKFTEECAATPELIELASSVSVKDEHTVVFQYLETEHIKMLDSRHQFLGNETYKPVYQEFKSSWLNVDGQLAIDSVSVETISDNDFTLCTEDSQLVNSSTGYFDDPVQVDAYDAKAYEETAAQSGRSDPDITNDNFSKNKHEKNDNVEDLDCSDLDSQTITIELLSSDDVKLYFNENSECHLQAKLPQLGQEKDLTTPANNSQPGHKLVKSGLQSKLSLSDIKFNCPHVDILVNSDEHFCPKCLKETPLLELDLEESSLSPLELDYQSLSPQLSKSNDEPDKSIFHKSVSVINSDPVISKCNTSKTTKSSDAQNLLSGELSVEKPLWDLGKETDGIIRLMHKETPTSKDSTVVKLPKTLSHKEYTEKLDVGIPSKIIAKKNPSLPKYPPYKKTNCSKTIVSQVKDDLFMPDFVIRKDQIQKLRPSDYSAFNKGNDRVAPIKISIPPTKPIDQDETVAKQQYNQKFDLSQVQVIGEVINHRRRRSLCLQKVVSAISDTNQEPHSFKNKLSKKVSLALYGSTGKSGDMAVHHCHERAKISYAPVFVSLSQRPIANNNDSCYTVVPSAKQKVFSQWSSKFVQAKPYKKRKQGEVFALKCKIKDLRKQVQDRNSVNQKQFSGSLKRKQTREDSPVTQPKKLKRGMLK